MAATLLIDLVVEFLPGVDGGPLVVVGTLTGLTTVSQGHDGGNCLVASVDSYLVRCVIS